MELSKLKKVNLRDVWKHEARDFTNWLAEEENLASLSDEIGIEISLIQTEASVGSFNVDIFAEEANSGRKIVIENQLESTDHDHLGKIITYASGFDAEIIIWIVKIVRDEHKQAIDWLNEQTNSDINFFAIQMEVWQIGTSPYAPKFQMIAKPNDWAKALKSASTNNQLSDTKLLQLEFWTQFINYVQENTKELNLRKPRPQHWYDISIGSSKAHISLTANSQSKEITCQIYISNSKPLFHTLFERKENIESKLETNLIWQELPTKKACRILISRQGDISDSNEWSVLHKWLLDQTISFKSVFSHNLK